MTSIHSFIISWEGKHANAETIAQAIKNQSDHTTIVYSDPKPDFLFDPSFESLRRPNDLMFGDKFQACLANCKSEILLLIHADCNCEQWSSIVKKCRDAFDEFPDINVWCPLIDFTSYNIKATEISKIADSNLSIAAATDAIVVAFRSSTIDKFSTCDLDKNLHGWGIDWILACHTYASNMIAVIDRSIHVHHEKTRDYSHEIAREEMIEFLDGLTQGEKTLYKLLKDYIKSRKAERRQQKEYRRKMKAERRQQKEDRRKNKRRFKFW